MNGREVVPKIGHGYTWTLIEVNLLAQPPSGFDGEKQPVLAVKLFHDIQ